MTIECVQGEIADQPDMDVGAKQLIPDLRTGGFKAVIHRLMPMDEAYCDGAVPQGGCLRNSRRPLLSPVVRNAKRLSSATVDPEVLRVCRHEQLALPLDRLEASPMLVAFWPSIAHEALRAIAVRNE